MITAAYATEAHRNESTFRCVHNMFIVQTARAQCIWSYGYEIWGSLFAKQIIRQTAAIYGFRWLCTTTIIPIQICMNYFRCLTKFSFDCVLFLFFVFISFSFFFLFFSFLFEFFSFFMCSLYLSYKHLLWICSIWALALFGVEQSTGSSLERLPRESLWSFDHNHNDNTTLWIEIIMSFEFFSIRSPLYHNFSVQKMNFDDDSFIGINVYVLIWARLLFPNS